MKMHKFEYKTAGGCVMECGSCGREAPLLKTSTDQLTCEICYSTLIGNATRYPGQYDNASLFIALAQVGNIILDKTTGRRDILPLPTNQVDN